jgi:hypothetical protein
LLESCSIMRTLDLRSHPVASFATGITLGLAAAGVAFVAARAAERRSLRLRERARAHPVIDGARPIDPVELTVGPPPESRQSAPRLESEMEDPEPFSQRW